MVEAKTRVVNIANSSFDVSIDRRTKWGNPYRISTTLNREDAVKAYSIWIRKQTDLMNSLKELEGKRLGCWCAPLPCHGDVLVALIEEKRKRES